MPPRHEPDELRAWLRLSLEPGLKPAAARALMAELGPPERIYALDAAELGRRLPPALAARLAAPPDAQVQAGIAAALAWLDAPGPHHVVTLADADYPPGLLAIADPPALLYVRGDPAALARPALAVVGARNATAGGLANARAFARHLAGAGWCVVSGLARGIDAAAHEGALEADPGGGTAAVLGTGMDRVYPRAHAPLAERIAERGALVSEFAPGTPPLPQHFPRRNRLVAGLARGVLVVEAASRSGSLSTARLAAEGGREVFAIPGSIHSPLSRGCHALIRQGARLVETALDIEEELGTPGGQAGGHAGALAGAQPGTGPSRGWAGLGGPTAPAAGEAASSPAPVPGSPPAGRVPASPPAALLWRALAYDPVHQDELQRRTGLAGPALQAGLLELELTGRALRLDGGRYQRVENAGG